mgnify:CR=1 FL=1
MSVCVQGNVLEELLKLLKLEKIERNIFRGPSQDLGFGSVFGGQVLGQAADGLLQITFAQILLFEIGPGATPWEIAKLLMVTLLPFSLVGPFAGVLIDRYDRRRVMVAVSVLRAMIVPPMAPWMAILYICRGISSRSLVQAVRASSTARSRCTSWERASTFSPLIRMSSLTRSVAW